MMDGAASMKRPILVSTWPNPVVVHGIESSKAVDVLALEKVLRQTTWFRTSLEQAGLLSRRGVASARQMVAVSPQERSCEEIRL